MRHPYRPSRNFYAIQGNPEMRNTFETEARKEGRKQYMTDLKAAGNPSEEAAKMALRREPRAELITLRDAVLEESELFYAQACGNPHISPSDSFEALAYYFTLLEGARMLQEILDEPEGILSYQPAEGYFATRLGLDDDAKQRIQERFKSRLAKEGFSSVEHFRDEMPQLSREELHMLQFFYTDEFKYVLAKSTHPNSDALESFEYLADAIILETYSRIICETLENNDLRSIEEMPLRKEYHDPTIRAN